MISFGSFRNRGDIPNLIIVKHFVYAILNDNFKCNATLNEIKGFKSELYCIKCDLLYCYFIIGFINSSKQLYLYLYKKNLYNCEIKNEDSFYINNIDSDNFSCQLMNSSSNEDILTCFYQKENSNQIIAHNFKFDFNINNYSIISLFTNSTMCNKMTIIKSALSQNYNKSLVCFINYEDKNCNCLTYSITTYSWSNYKAYLNGCLSNSYSLNIEYYDNSNEYILYCFQSSSIFILKKLNDNFEIKINEKNGIYDLSEMTSQCKEYYLSSLFHNSHNFNMFISCDDEILKYEAGNNLILPNTIDMILINLPETFIITTLPKTALLTTLPKTTILTTLPKTTILTTLPKTTILTSLSAATIFTTIPETNILTTLPETTILTTLPETTILTTLPEITILTTLLETTILKSFPLITILTSIVETTILTTLPKTTILTTLPETTILTSLPEKNIIANSSISTILTSLPKTFILTNIPKTIILTYIPETNILTNIPKTNISTNIPEKTIVSITKDSILTNIPTEIFTTLAETSIITTIPIISFSTFFHISESNIPRLPNDIHSSFDFDSSSLFNNDLTHINNSQNDFIIIQKSIKSKEEIINNLDEVMKNYEIGKIYEIYGEDYNIKISPINTRIYGNIVTYINFSNCENILRAKNNLNSSSILTVYQIEIDNYHEKSLINNVEYAVFNENKNQLDLSVCGNEFYF